MEKYSSENEMREETQIVFRPFELDLANERLRRGKEEIRLHPKAFAVLRCLLEHSGRLVTKDALLAKVWAGLHVTDAVLKESIREIRQALGDDPKKPRFIETVHRRGYRFLSPVANGLQAGAATMKQDIRFCKAVDGIRIAYSTMGQGPPLVIPPQLVTHLEADLSEGPFGDVYEALAQHHTLIRFDMRGTGLSDRNVSLLSEEAFILDLEAAVDELRLHRFALYGFSAGGRLILQYYAKHPDRVSHLIFYGTSPAAPDEGRREQQSVTLSVIRASWEVGSKLMAERLLPYGGTREDIERLARWIRASVTSEGAQKLIELRQNRADLRHLLAKVSVPTLIIHRRGDHVPFAGGIELASKIPEARFWPLEGCNHLPAMHDEAMELVTPVVAFLAGGKKASVAPPEEIAVPVTFLFTEIKGSASLTRRLSADGVQKLIQAHRETARGAIESYKGKELNAVGSAIVASFFSPSRAVGCALHINQVIAERNAANPENSVRVRMGLNASEPIAGDHGFVSLAQTAGQVCEQAKPGQVLVSDVVRQLAAGKGFTFEHLSVKRIKGFDGPVALYKVSNSRTIVSGPRTTPRYAPSTPVTKAALK